MRNKEPKPQKEPKQKKQPVEKIAPTESRSAFSFISGDERELVHLHNHIEQRIEGKIIQTEAEMRITDKRLYLEDRATSLKKETVIGLDRVEYVGLESSLRKKRHVFLIILSILIMLAGGILAFFLKNYFLTAISGAGLILLIIALATGRKIYTNELILGLTFGSIRITVGNVPPDEARALERSIVAAIDFMNAKKSM